MTKLKRRTLIAHGIALAMLPAFDVLAASPVGKAAPDFTAPASHNGQTTSFSLKNALAHGPVVVYFFPAAYTKGCDVQAHLFADQQPHFADAGATIIGVSADAIERLNQFSADPDFCAGKFAVASDPDGQIAARWGLQMMPPQPGLTDEKGRAITHGFLPRTTFVLDGKGKIVKRLSSQDDGLSPDQHVSQALTLVQQIQARH